MSLEETARKVIKNAIRSAICIDDEYAPPYPKENSKLNTEEPSKLYYSFREKGHCDLDIYHFESIEKSWKPDYMIPNKDLIILDWELDKGGNKFDSTLLILKNIVESDKIPFVLIYTNTEDLNQIIKELIARFNPYSKDELISLVVKFVGKFKNLVNDNDLDQSDIEDFLESRTQTFYEYFTSFSRREEIAEDILTAFSQTFEIEKEKARKKFNIIFKEFFGEEEPSVGMAEFCKIALTREGLYKCRIDRIEISPLALKIGSTSVIIYHKQSKQDGIQPENLFEQFSQAIQNNPHNYLTLLSLELKDRLREDFSLIGNAFANIDEQAFFYHLSSYKEGEEYQVHLIHDFIIKSWIEDLIQHNYRRVPDVLEYVTNKIAEVSLPTSLAEVKKNPSLVQELIKYSSFISNVNFKRDLPELRFGDIFLDQEAEHFYICITPHCDCLRPKKIQHNFYFIKGEKYDNVKALQEAETEYNSFVVHKEELVSIKWMCKPFTAYIPANDINELTFDYCGKEVRLEYVTTLKENHVQRIANQSFGYGYRVGIDLPHISK